MKCQCCGRSRREPQLRRCFTNEYNWGDFRGDPEKLMHRYFDAHVYVANWMTAIFMVRLPIEALTQETATAVAVPYLLDINPTKAHWIITWSLEESENYDRFGLEDGRGWMARLAPVRDELLRGDLRRESQSVLQKCRKRPIGSPEYCR